MSEYVAVLKDGTVKPLNELDGNDEMILACPKNMIESIRDMPPPSETLMRELWEMSDKTKELYDD